MPIDAATLAIFYTAALALNLTPGNDMMYVLGQSLRGGFRTGLAASLGIAGGSLVHLVLVAMGLAVVLARHPLVFDAIRYAGAAYLLWIAFQALHNQPAALVAETVLRTPWAAFRDGVLVNLLNPKIIVFMFAFLPPFIRPENGSALLQLLILGTIFNVNGTVINALVALFAGRIRERLSGSASFARWFSRLSAGLFTLLAIRLILEKRVT